MSDVCNVLSCLFQVMLMTQKSLVVSGVNSAFSTEIVSLPNCDSAKLLGQVSCRQGAQLGGLSMGLILLVFCEQPQQTCSYIIYLQN